MYIEKYEFAARILKYWYLIEFLDQTNFPVEGNENRDAIKRVVDGKTDWCKQITVYHTFLCDEKSPTTIFGNDSKTYPAHAKISDEVCICIGKVHRRECDKYLRQKFGLIDDTVEKDYSKICLLGLKCDAQGNYIEKSLNISPLIWGITRLQHFADKVSNEVFAELLSLNDYSTDVSSAEEQLMHCDADGKRSGRALSSELLQQLFNTVENTYIIPLFGNRNYVTPEGVMIYKRYQSDEDKATDSESLK